MSKTFLDSKHCGSSEQINDVVSAKASIKGVKPDELCSELLLLRYKNSRVRKESTIYSCSRFLISRAG